jgi:DNA-binding transcriptional regulator YdaS (Cro superfamily)
MTWLDTLRTVCAAEGQKTVAQRLGFSPTTISQVLSDTYNADTKRVQAAVEGALMGARVDCPVIGDIPRQACIAHQRRKGRFAATNPARVALAKACKRCEHRTEE